MLRRRTKELCLRRIAYRSRHFSSSGLEGWLPFCGSCCGLLLRLWRGTRGEGADAGWPSSFAFSPLAVEAAGSPALCTLVSFCSSPRQSNASQSLSSSSSLSRCFSSLSAIEEVLDRCEFVLSSLLLTRRSLSFLD